MKRVEQLELRDVKGGASLPVKVVPGSSRDKVVGVLGSALKIATSAPAGTSSSSKANSLFTETSIEPVISLSPGNICPSCALRSG